MAVKVVSARYLFIENATGHDADDEEISKPQRNYKYEKHI